MRIRADSVFASCLLHTLALLFFVRAAFWNYFSGTDKAALAKMDEGFRAEAQTAHYFGIACLAIILIGLIVVWSGYAQRRPSAWFVMFAIVWVWAFPIFMLPLVVSFVHGRFDIPLSEFLYNAISSWGLPRTVVELTLAFSAMVIALLLPAKRFLVKGEPEWPLHRPSAGFIGLSVISILTVLVGLYTWVRVGVLYQIPVTELNSTQRLPLPVAPPQHIGD